MRAGALLLSALACSCHGREVAAPRPAVVVVLVRAAGDVPVPGARVELFLGPVDGELTDEDAMRYRPSTIMSQAIATVVTDAKGRAALDLPPAGRYWISATARGMGRTTVGATVATGEEPPSVILPLVPGRAFTGTVADDRGIPVGGVEVVAAPTWRCRMWPCDPACDRAWTDASGRFRFDALSPGEYAIWHRPVERLPLSIRGHAGTEVSHATADGTFVNAGTVLVPTLGHLPIQTTEGGRIHGVVRDAESGTPLGAAIRVLDDEDQIVAEGHTGLDGRILFLRTHVPECSIGSIAVLAAGYAPTPIAPEDLPRHLADGQSLNLDLRVQKGATLRGRVLGPGGPITGASVGVFGERKRCTTDANGEYRLTDLDPGTYTPEVDRILVDAQVEVAAGADVVQDLRVEPTPGTPEVHEIKGRVLDPEGAGVRGARVWSGEGARRNETTTDARGRFALRVVAFDGCTVVEADPPPGSDLLHDTVWLDEFDHELEIRLWYGARIRGHVRATDGSALAGARVVAGSGEVGSEVFLFHFDGLGECLTAADGSYEIRFREFPDLLRVSAPDGSTAQTLRFDEEDRSLRADVTMPRSRLVSGRAIAKGPGGGIPGLLVSLVIRPGVGEAAAFLLPGAAACAVTDENGGFRVPFPSDERAAIELAGAGFVPTIAEPPDGEFVVEMERDLPVSGVVRLANGDPACLADVVLRREDGWESGPSTADSDGVFVIRGVPAGDYAVVVDGVERAQVRAGERVEVAVPE